MIVFIDFDGVLHPVRGADKFQHMPAFLELLDDFPEIRIVVSSSWRSILDEDILRSMFERHGLKLVGVTGELANPDEIYGRMQEIENWIREHEYTGPWLAIDDSTEQFSMDCSDLFSCDPEKGLDEETIKALRTRLELMLRK